MNYNLMPYQVEILERIKKDLAVATQMHYYQIYGTPFDEFWDSLPVEEPEINIEPFDRFLGLSNASH